MRQYRSDHLRSIKALIRLWSGRHNGLPTLNVPELVSPLSPEDAIARLEEYARDWHESRIPEILRKRGVRAFVLRRSESAFRMRLVSSARWGIQCVGEFAANGPGSTIRYELALDRPTVISLCCVGAAWLVMLFLTQFPLLEVLGIGAIAGLYLFAMAGMHLAYLRGTMASGVDELLRGVLRCDHHDAAT